MCDIPPVRPFRHGTGDVDPIRNARKQTRRYSARLKDLEVPIAPDRSGDVPFWPMNGEAVSGCRADTAVSSSIFPHPWFHHPLHPVSEREQQLREILRGQVSIRADDITFELRPPGDVIDRTSTAGLIVQPRTPHRPPLIGPADAYMAWRKTEGDKKRKRSACSDRTAPDDTQVVDRILDGCRLSSRRVMDAASGAHRAGRRGGGICAAWRVLDEEALLREKEKRVG